MRWIDIILPEPGINRELDELLDAAAAKARRVAIIQARDGLDAVTATMQIAATGNLLFQAVTTWNTEAFSPDQAETEANAPALDDPAHDDLVGYHLVVDSAWVGLPWSWLHNGIGFLLERHPICAATCGSRLPTGSTARPWMQRLERARFLVGDDGGRAVRSILPQLRATGTLPPEMLFIPGHTDRQRRRLIYREAEAIGAALEDSAPGEILARLDLPASAITPSHLYEQGVAYQVLHFAGPTSYPARANDEAGEYWMNRLIEESAAPADDDIDRTLGLEGEVLGVDPITSLLDDVTARYGRRDAKAMAHTSGGQTTAWSVPGDEADDGEARTWLLDDGPVLPENLGRRGQLPPLVFSNSYRALPELGKRFLAAGASTFIGPTTPLFSRPARLFASHFYRGLGEGWSAGGALWRAAGACRRELGDSHPAWVSYGLQGYGNLALQYL